MQRHSKMRKTSQVLRTCKSDKDGRINLPGHEATIINIVKIHTQNSHCMNKLIFVTYIKELMS